MARKTIPARKTKGGQGKSARRKKAQAAIRAKGRYDDPRTRDRRHRSGNYGGTPESWDTKHNKGQNRTARTVLPALKGSSKRKQSVRIMKNYAKGGSTDSRQGQGPKGPRKSLGGQKIYPSHVASANNARQFRQLEKFLTEAARQAHKDRMK